MRTLTFTLSTFLSLNAFAQAPVAGYYFNGNADDISANAINGTLETYKISSFADDNPPVLVDGHDGTANSAYRFPSLATGGQGRIGFGQPAELDFGTNSFSISYWFKPSSSSIAASAIANGDGTSNGFRCGTNVVNAVKEAVFYMGSGPAIEFGTYNADLQMNTWYHYTVTVDRENNIIKLYLDGAQHDIQTWTVNSGGNPTGGSVTGADYTITNASVSAEHQGNLQFGLSMNIPSSHFVNGALDDVFFFDRVLSSSEVSDLYNGVVPGQASGIADVRGLEVLNLYPNPATDVVIVSDLASQNSNYAVLNSLGMQVLSGKLVGGTIDVSSLSKGVYILRTDERIGRFIVN